MAELLTPQEYKDKIKALQDRRKKLEALSYNSEKRGYEFEGKVLGQSDLDTAISATETSKKTLTSQLSKSLKTSGASTKKSLELGVEYKKLVDAAIAVEVTDYESSIENLKAWRNVQTFVENNKDIKSVETVTKNPSVLEIATSWLRTGIGPKYVKTVKDVDPKKVQVNTDRAVALANGFAERDTTERGTRIRKDGQKVSTDKVTVTDEPTLSARQIEIDAIKTGQEAPVEIATSARKGTAPVSKITLASKTVAGKVPVVKRVDASGRSGMGATPPKTPLGGGGGGGGGGTTGSGTGLKKDEVIFDGKKVKVGGSKWQQIIQDEFGSMWDVYNDNPEVKKVIDLSVKEGWYNDEVKLTSRLQNTNWFRTTESATRQFNIKKSTDPATLEADINKGIEDTRALSLKSGSGVVLADGTLRMLTENKIKFGWSDQQLLNAIGSEAIATAQGGAQGVAALRQGTVAAGLRASADDYAQKVDPAMLDMWTQEILKGSKTETQFTDLMKLQASQQYRSLAPQIEKDQTVKEAVTMYSNAAQNVLGIDPSTIDWTQDKWGKALNYQDPKTNEYRTMDSSEWNRHLRSLPEWKKTDGAKNAYRNLALTLASGFGKTL
jgi:hypothetical protein